MTSDRKRWLWRIVKGTAALVVLFFIGLSFRTDLQKLKLSKILLRLTENHEMLIWQRSPDPEHTQELVLHASWFAVAGGVYLIALLPQAWFWRHVQLRFGYPLPFYAALRAHFIGQLGKYVPGKALAVLIRSHLIHPCGVPYGVSVIASFYEVFTVMASGAMVACLIFVFDPPRLAADLQAHPALVGLVLIGMCGIPLLPGVFNFIVAKLSAKIQAIELYRLPPLRFPTLALGLAGTSISWWLQGLSVWALFQAVLPEPPALSLSVLAQCTAAIAFSNVAGFVIVFLPAGLGIREALLLNMLGDAGPREYIAVAVILLRLNWIIAEVLVLALYWIPPRAVPTEYSVPSTQASDSSPVTTDS